ncbi:AMP-binding protein [Nakamurella sp. YIM 132084]|uniref:AMP-binding protein n=1 Tax=Nakamurella leprariae TaxID=2803911 RepID=A0A938Y5U9_9ACTN|nr:AMP-binding protein [Nakamurella leprariae]
MGAWVPVPGDVAARYRDAGYWTDQTFPGLLDAAVQRFADRTAVIDTETRWSYRDLELATERVAAGLHGVGVRRGDRVVVQLPNVAAYVAVLFSCWRIGALPVFALPAHRDSELLHFCTVADAAALVTADRIAGYDHAALAQRVAARSARPPVLVLLAAPAVVAGPAPREPVVAPENLVPTHDLAAWLAGSVGPAPVATPSAPDEVAFLQLSGGTTGTPKLIPRTPQDYLYSVRESARICELTPDDVMLVALPAAHNFPMSSPGILGVVHAGGTVVLASDPAPTTCLPLIEAERVTVAALVPPLALLWLSSVGRPARPGRPRPDLSSLRLLQVGGAKLVAEAARRVESELGCRLQQVFGMAEGLVNYTRPEDDFDTVVDTQGRPISPADEVRVVDADGRDLPDGEAGELLTRGPYTIRGYYEAADHNATAFTADGFYRTGDLVVRRPSGHLTVVGRVKDQINRGGDKIASDEIENHLVAHPGVLDAAVVGVPDQFLGERSCAFVRPEPDGPLAGPLLVDPDGSADRAADRTAVERELRAFLRGRGLATYKIPDVIVLVAEFPGTGVGKVSRRELRQRLAADAAPAP